MAVACSTTFKAVVVGRRDQVVPAAPTVSQECAEAVGRGRVVINTILEAVAEVVASGAAALTSRVDDFATYAGWWRSGCTASAWTSQRLGSASS